MSIELNCPICGKKIRAPQEAAGKRGNCPHCKKELYIPMPAGDVEDIALAPINEEEERRAEQLRRESTEYTASLTRDKAPAYDTGAIGGTPPAGGSAADPVDIPTDVKKFVLFMHESKLDKAEMIAGSLKRAGKRARDYVQGLLVDQIPPKIGKVPEPLIRGFLKTLSDQLGK